MEGVSQRERNQVISRGSHRERENIERVREKKRE